MDKNNNIPPEALQPTPSSHSVSAPHVTNSGTPQFTLAAAVPDLPNFPYICLHYSLYHTLTHAKHPLCNHEHSFDSMHMLRLEWLSYSVIWQNINTIRILQHSSSLPLLFSVWGRRGCTRSMRSRVASFVNLKRDRNSPSVMAWNGSIRSLTNRLGTLCWNHSRLSKASNPRNILQ